MEFSLLDFNLLWTCNPFFLWISPFWNGMPNICLPSHCILETNYLFSKFHRSTDGEGFAPGWKTLSLIHTLFRWFWRWDSGLFELIMFIGNFVIWCCNGLRLLGILGWVECILYLGKAWLLESKRADDYALNCVPLKYVEVYTLVHMNAILFENRVFCRCNYIKIRSFWDRVNPNPTYWHPYKNRRKDIGKGQCHMTIKEEIGVIWPHIWSYMAYSIYGIYTIYYQRLRKRYRTDSSSEPLGSH